jgi:Ca2+/Na+ antiporter
MHLYRKYFPIFASAYSAAIFIFFTFISKENISVFMYGNIILMSFWAAYCWVIVYNQDSIITHLTDTIKTVEENLKTLIEQINENEEV